MLQGNSITPNHDMRQMQNNFSPTPEDTSKARHSAERMGSSELTSNNQQSIERTRLELHSAMNISQSDNPSTIGQVPSHITDRNILSNDGGSSVPRGPNADQ